jgi:ribonucleoside-diphosphate reductase alpha chain
LYILSWKAGLKGQTIYVDGSRDPILSVDKEEEKQEEQEISAHKLNYIRPTKRGDIGSVLVGETYKKDTACGTLYITINKDEDGNIVELFTNSSKNGTCKANLNAETRLVSLALRSGVAVDEVMDTLKAIQCQSCAFSRAKGNKIDGTSCPDIIAKCIKESYNRGARSLKPSVKHMIKNISEEKKDVCPECGEHLIHTGGCISCSCGWSKCG